MEDTSNITQTIINTINTIFENLFASIDNNLYSLLDEITFINSDIIKNQTFEKIFGTSTSNGILIDAGNIDELSKAMVKCCMDEQWMQNAYNANIDKMFALYNMEKKHNQLRKCYETLNESI